MMKTGCLGAETLQRLFGPEERMAGLAGGRTAPTSRLMTPGPASRQAGLHSPDHSFRDAVISDPSVHPSGAS